MQHPPIGQAPEGLQLINGLIQIGSERARRELKLFVERAWHIVEPKFLQWNWHMDAICEHLTLLSMGEIKNLVIMVPPRMTKSLICSVMWPVWHWLQKPQTQFLGASYNVDLALRDAVLSRRIIESGWFQKHYGGEFFLLHDENTKDRYANSKGGRRITTSVNGRSTGEGGDIQILDDPHNAQKIESDTIRNNALTWHDNAWRSRRNDPNNSQKLYVAQRTHDADILGHVLRQEGSRWVSLVLPMEHDPARKCITYPNKGDGPIKDNGPIFVDPRKVEGELLNPKRFNASTAQQEKDVMSDRAWQAQYQQQPEGAGGLILKRHWWQEWCWPEGHKLAGEERPLPEFFEIIQVYDTAFEEDQEADYTARTTWGLFLNTEPFEGIRSGRRVQTERVSAILLDRYKDRPGFPELRKVMIDSDKDFEPDSILIEKKASGHSLIQEGRRKHLPIKAVKVVGDLVFRAHMAALMLEKRCIYYVPRTWSFDVINECAAFPQGEHDDQVSSVVMALQYMRRYYDLTLPDDEHDEIDPFRWEKREIGYA